MRERDIVDFELVNEIDAEAIGQPGQRRFRIRARKGDETGSLWLEKQQLQALCLAIRRTMAQSQTSLATPAPASPMPYFPSEATIDFQVGDLALGWDEAAQRFTVLARPITAGGQPSAFRCQIDVAQASAFCELAEAVCASGRRTCPLCLEPIDPGGHTCARTNGHFRGREIPEAEDQGGE